MPRKHPRQQDKEECRGEKEGKGGSTTATARCGTLAQSKIKCSKRDQSNQSSKGAFSALALCAHRARPLLVPAARFSCFSCVFLPFPLCLRRRCARRLSPVLTNRSQPLQRAFPCPARLVLLFARSLSRDAFARLLLKRGVSLLSHSGSHPAR